MIPESHISLKKFKRKGEYHSWLLSLSQLSHTNSFLNFNRTKPPHILTHAGAFLRAILVAHDHRNPCHWLVIEIFSDRLSLCYLAPLINAPRILYLDGDEFLANRFARMETFRITRGRSAIANRDTNAPPSRSLNGFIGLRTHVRTNDRCS